MNTSNHIEKINIASLLHKINQKFPFLKKYTHALILIRVYETRGQQKNPKSAFYE